MTVPRQPSDLGFKGSIRAVILGARGGIGGAFISHLGSLKGNHMWVGTSRDKAWCAEEVDVGPGHRRYLDLTEDASISQFADWIQSSDLKPNLVVNCTGLLHEGPLQPERSWRHLERASMLRSLDVHVCGLSLLIRHILPLMPRNERGVFATLSARVGSIEDNRLGGWFSYRASKAAQNMVLKTASIEAARRWPELVLLSLHPGTVDTALSEPFSKRVPEHKLFSPKRAATQLCEVIEGKSPADSGCIFAWDGSPIPW